MKGARQRGRATERREAIEFDRHEAIAREAAMRAARQAAAHTPTHDALELRPPD